MLQDTSIGSYGLFESLVLLHLLIWYQCDTNVTARGRVSRVEWVVVEGDLGGWVTVLLGMHAGTGLVGCRVSGVSLLVCWGIGGRVLFFGRFVGISVGCLCVFIIRGHTGL